MRKKILDKIVDAFLRMGRNKHGLIPEPTKEDLERKFVMRVDRKGNPIIREITE